ncbi:unnamed protein product [Rhizopus microsporus]
MVTLGCVLTKVSPLSLKYRDAPTVQILYDISRVALEHEIQNEERAVEILLSVCENNQDQYKRLIEAIEEDENDPKRARVYANDGLIYNEHVNSSSKPTHKSLLRTIDPNPKKTNMEYRTTKKRMNWKACFDEGRNAGYLGTYSNSQSLKNIFNKLNPKH